MRHTPWATPHRLIGAAVATLLVAFAFVAVGGLPAVAATTAGATLPFSDYEAEAGTLAGGAGIVSLTSAPTTQYSSATLEASGMRTFSSPASARACSGRTTPDHRSARSTSA